MPKGPRFAGVGINGGPPVRAKKLKTMEYKKIKRGQILYWDSEPVKVNSKQIDPQYGECVHITRYAADDKKQNGFATVAANELSKTAQ